MCLQLEAYNYKTLPILKPQPEVQCQVLSTLLLSKWDSSPKFSIYSNKYHGWQSSQYHRIHQHGLRDKVSRLTFIIYSGTELCSCMERTGGYCQSLTKHFHPGTEFSLNQTSCRTVHTRAHIPKHHLSTWTPSMPARRHWRSRTGIDNNLPSAQGASIGQQTFPVELSSQLCHIHSWLQGYSRKVILSS